MWKEWFSYTKSQRYGILTLALMVVVVAFYPFAHQTLFTKPSPLLTSNSFHKVDSFYNALTYSKPKVETSFSMSEEERPAAAVPEEFYFDPNTVSTSELVRLGLTPRQAASIENYRQKGGLFAKPDDFAKMYVVNKDMFERLKPYIKIAPAPEQQPKDSTTYPPQAQFAKTESKIYIDLNTVDTLEITRIRGIGRSYARRIISYRERLGGFYNTNQLTEVYGFPKDLLSSIQDQIWVDTLAINTININLVDYQELRRHPYLTDYQAKAIIYYRETMSNFSKIEDIRANKLIDEQTYQRIKPYLTIN